MSLFERYGLDRAAIKGITEDSRQVKAGYIFAALPGSRVDGRDYIEAAVGNGASIILSTPDANMPGGVRLIGDENPRRLLSLLAAEFYAMQPAHIVAVTGTNGKTSTVSFVEQIWAALGYKAASLGTLGLRGGEAKQSGLSMTTPDPVSLMADLADLKAAGIDHLAMEASSHGLDQHRMDGVKVAAAGFTNLTRDHLDYHGTMENYLAAKARLFADVLVEDGTAVLNADSDVYESLAEVTRTAGRSVISYGEKGEHIRIESVQSVPTGQQAQLIINGQNYDLTAPFIGYFQLKNLLCAIGLVMVSSSKGLKDIDLLVRILDILPSLQAPPGRLQFVPGHPSGAGVYVDYAHTPDALETVLKAVRPHTYGRVMCVFGCGGDRDAGKRPMMGKAASEYADLVIVTDDNPRSENSDSIRREILQAAHDALDIGDRAEAIHHAIKDLKDGDILVIAGKGHEQGQIIKDKTLPFDDVSVAADAITSLNS